MNILIETLVGILILAILAAAQYSTSILMPMSMTAVLLVSLIVGFLIFIALIWREKAVDERDSVHMHKAGRWSFFIGATVLVIGIAVQTFEHEIDPWLLYALAAMVLTKTIARVIHYVRN